LKKLFELFNRAPGRAAATARPAHAATDRRDLPGRAVAPAIPFSSSSARSIRADPKEIYESRNPYSQPS
jgi:hypothetical protein